MKISKRGNERNDVVVIVVFHDVLGVLTLMSFYVGAMDHMEAIAWMCRELIAMIYEVFSFGNAGD